MKIVISLSNSEKSYIQRTIRRFAPDYDQTSMWSDTEAKTPAYRSTQRTDSNGNIEATLDVNSDFIMDLVDVTAEIVEKVKSFGFMLKGALESFESYGKGVSKRFERWQSDDQKAAKAARCMHIKAVKEERSRLNSDMYVAVCLDENGKDHAVFGESAEQMSSRSGNMRKDLHIDKVWYFLFIKNHNTPIPQTKDDIDGRIAREQAMKGKREAAVDETKPAESTDTKADDGWM